MKTYEHIVFEILDRFDTSKEFTYSCLSVKNIKELLQIIVEVLEVEDVLNHSKSLSKDLLGDTE